MKEILAITKALADPSRVRIVLYLREGELCACQITAALGLAPSTVSRHLSELERAGLVMSRKEGRWIYYQRPDAKASSAIRMIFAWLDDSMGDAPDLDQGFDLLAKIRKAGPQALCAANKNKKPHG